MGLVVGVVGAVVSLALAVLTTFALWPLVGMGVAWLVALGFIFIHGHRAFGTGANTDFMLAFAGFAIAAAVVVPKALEARPCGQVRKSFDAIVAAQEGWRRDHGSYVGDLDGLGVKRSNEVQVDLTTDGGAYRVSVTHPACLGDDGRPMRLTTRP